MKEIKITIPDDYYIIQPAYRTDDTIKIVLQKKETSLPKSWEEFCEMFPTIKAVEYYVGANSGIIEGSIGRCRKEYDKNLLPDRATAEAILALCQLIQLRNCYNDNWVPDWSDYNRKFIIGIYNNDISVWSTRNTASVLFFKTEKLRDEFLRNFRDLIEKLKPLYGIKEGGKE